MKLNDYIKQAIKTDCEDYDTVIKRVQKAEIETADDLQTTGDSPVQRSSEVTHGALDLNQLSKIIGLLDIYKKKIMYGRGLQAGETVPVSHSFQNKRQMRLFHGIIGIITEAGELLDQLVNSLEAKEVDLVNIGEEAGDIMWYLALIADEFNVDLEAQLDKNIAKLKARYGDKFTEKKAINRDLEIERGILER